MGKLLTSCSVVSVVAGEDEIHERVSAREKTPVRRSVVTF